MRRTPNADTDGDGLPDALEIGSDPQNPLDSDGDGIIDALEPGDAAHDAGRIAGLALLDGIPGRTQEGFPLAGGTVAVQADSAWQFLEATTGLLQLTAANDEAGAIPDTTLGDAGLDYRHGYVRLRSVDTPVAVGALVQAVSFEPLSSPVAVQLNYEAELPPANRLLVYATQIVAGRERYVLMSPNDYRRIDDHTLEVRVRDNGPHDVDGDNGFIVTGVALTENTLGGVDLDSGNGGSGSLGWSVLALLPAVGGKRRRVEHRSAKPPVSAGGVIVARAEGG